MIHDVALPLRVRRGVGQLPGQQLRPRRHAAATTSAREAADGNGTNNANFSTPRPTTAARRGCRCTCGRATSSARQNQRRRRRRRRRSTPPGRASRPPATPAGLPGRTLVYAGTGCAAATYPTPLPTGELDRGRRRRHRRDRVPVPASARRSPRPPAPKALVVAHNADGAAPILTGSMIAAPPDDPGGRGHAGRRHRDQGRDRRRPDDRQRPQAPGASRHPRRRLRERDHHPRVRARRLQPPHRRSRRSTA